MLIEINYNGNDEGIPPLFEVDIPDDSLLVSDLIEVVVNLAPALFKSQNMEVHYIRNGHIVYPVAAFNQRAIGVGDQAIERYAKKFSQPINTSSQRLQL